MELQLSTNVTSSEGYRGLDPPSVKMKTLSCVHVIGQFSELALIKSRLVCWYLKQIIMSLKHIFFEMFWYAVADFSSFDIKL